MFRWYRDASTCYAYLADVEEPRKFTHSRWFTRGWTLQELIAPKNVWFYSSDWHGLGSKLDLQHELHRITGIEVDVLTTGTFAFISMARRMSWASERQTTRIEDKAYSLMGIFDVNMPLLYGEGQKSFIRLQEAIMKISNDQSLFAWGMPMNVRTMQEFTDDFSLSDATPMHGIFADSPSDFTFSDRIYVVEDPQSTLPPIVSNNGVRIELQVKKGSNSHVRFAILYCTMKEKYKHYLGFPILSWGGRWYARCGELVLIGVADLVDTKSDVPYRKPTVLLIKAPVSQPPSPKSSNAIELVHISNQYEGHYILKDVECATHASYSWSDQTLTLSGNPDALHAAFHYAPAIVDPVQVFDSQHYDRLRRGEETTLNASRRTDSFVTAAENKKEKLSITYPPFALLVGGSSIPWVQRFILLSDEDPDEDFARLAKADGELVASCTTRQCLSSLLQRNVVHDSAIERHPHGGQGLIMHAHLSYKVWEVYEEVVHNARGRGAPVVRKRAGRRLTNVEHKIWVDAQVRVVSCNLVGKSLVLFVEVLDSVTKEPKAFQNLKWWSFNAQS
jgi:hypothetical protein